MRPALTKALPKLLAINQILSRKMSNFRIRTYTLRTQHSRERWAATELDQENTLRLHVKQYIPLSNPNPQQGDVTIIGAVANSFPKETAEPYWDDLYEVLKAKGRRIRGIWIADPVNQGESGVLNERVLGPDPSWWDHGRDLLFLINQFQDEMPHPIVGIGHSMGTGHLVHLSLLHPRLLHSLILMDTVIQQAHNKPGLIWAAASANRRDLWPSRQAAADKMRANPAFQVCDPRVLDKYIEYGLRELPTELYPDVPEDGGVPVTLQTTKAQEQYNYVKPTYEDERLLLEEGQVWGEFYSADREDVGGEKFSRSENKMLWHRLSELKPSVLFVPGKKSGVSTPQLRRRRLEITGTGPGGSGGLAKGRVKEAVVDAGHLVPYERPREAAQVSADFLNDELERWTREDEDRRQRWSKLSRRERVDINDAWRDGLGVKSKGETKKTAPPEKL
ncbi:hypothetical protein PRZ48_005711 [Zasmidium cellare]|uniref:Toxin biosynthesis protein n=1 Tax=Zasmidium cellare TaxID=395010 RepID=A0ABR0ELY1_ZASCE|nr:hypothetical protein PRZ48_005711 [Zasmidium cellare]